MPGPGRQGKRAAGSAPAAAAQAPGLLDLPDALLERILGRLGQEQLRCTIPLVCRRLDAVQRGSSSQWRWVGLNLSLDVPPDFSFHHLFVWLDARRAAIQHLTLWVSDSDDNSMLERAGAVLSLLGPRLHILELHGASIADHEENVNSAAQMLQPLSAATQLRRLELNLSADEQVPPVQLPALPKLGRLAATLEDLQWATLDPRLPGGISKLTGLTSVSLSNVAVELCAAALAPLSRLVRLHAYGDSSPGSLDFVLALTGLESLLCTNAGLRTVPAGITALSKLTYLHLSSNCFSAASSLDALSGLTALAHLTLSSCQLPALPRSLSALTGLTDLRLAGNDTMQLRASDVRNVFGRLARLRRLCLSQATSQRVPFTAWVSLGRKCPHLVH